MYTRLAELYDMFRMDCQVACDVCEAVKYVVNTLVGKGCLSRPWQGPAVATDPWISRVEDGHRQ
jgi:hypothetical protein